MATTYASIPPPVAKVGLNVPAGEYTLRFTGELYDCRRLMHYCDAMPMFAGHFSLLVAKFEENLRYWRELGHGETREPYRWSINLELGSLNAPRDFTRAPRFFPRNETKSAR